MAQLAVSKASDAAQRLGDSWGADEVFDLIRVEIKTVAE